MSWYFVERGERVGPLTDEELSAQESAGRVAAETLVWRDGMPGWKPLREARGTPPLAAGTLACTECRRALPEDELVRYGGRAVCAACKPAFLQKLREGHLPSGLLAYGSFWARFGAKFIDGVLLWIVNFPIQLLVMGSMVFRPGASPEGFWSRYFVTLFLTTGVSAAYSIGLNGRWGATLGKRAVHLRIVRPDGGPIGYGKATARYFAEILSAFTLFIGYVMAAFDDERRALHDRICDTRVVQA